MRYQRGLIFLVFFLFGLASMPATAQPVDEVIEATLSLSGRLEAKRRVSDNFSMTVENWVMDSDYTQNADYTLVRETSGRIGGVPTYFFGTMEDRNMLFEPTLSPFDVVEFKLTGSIKVTGCASLTDSLSAHRESGYVPGVNQPMSMPPGVSGSMPNMGFIEGLANRGAFYFERCGRQGDKVLVFYLPPPGLFQVPGAGPITCNDEYAYERSAGEAGQYNPYLFTEKYKKAVKSECSSGSASITEDMAFLGSVSWSQLADQEEVRLQRTYQGEEGVPSGDEPWEYNKLYLTLDINPRGNIHAEPGGPYPLDRGKTVVLDGSGSVPSKGHRIQSYEWELTPQGTPEGCAGIGSSTRMSGATVSFTALCSVKVRLTVKDDGGKEDEGDTEVIVKARPWKTVFKTDPVIVQENFTFVPGGFVFGYNRCKNHVDALNIDTVENHWYEPRGGQGNDYEVGSFELDQVTDSGPFSGVVYVSKDHFLIERRLWVNKRLYRGGDVYELNPKPDRQVESCAYNQQPVTTCSFGPKVINRLRAAVKTHEQLHSDLANKALERRSDPARDIESLMNMNRQKVRDDANGFLQSAASDMSNASNESKVMAAMPNQFRAGGCIDFPEWGSADRGGCYYRFSSFTDKGEKTSN